MAGIPPIPRVPMVDKDGNLHPLWRRWFIDLQREVADPLAALVASRLVATDANTFLASVANLASWIAGTADKVTVTNDGDGTITLTIPNTYLPGSIAGVASEIDVADDGDGTVTIGLVNPLIVGKGGTGVATLTDHGILLGSGTGAVTPLGVATNGQLPIGSTGADPVLAAITGTASQITVTNAAGSITLSLDADVLQISNVVCYDNQVVCYENEVVTY